MTQTCSTGRQSCFCARFQGRFICVRHRTIFSCHRPWRIPRSKFASHSILFDNGGQSDQFHFVQNCAVISANQQIECRIGGFLSPLWRYLSRGCWRFHALVNSVRSPSPCSLSLLISLPSAPSHHSSLSTVQCSKNGLYSCKNRRNEGRGRGDFSVGCQGESDSWMWA